MTVRETAKASRPVYLKLKDDNTLVRSKLFHWQTGAVSRKFSVGLKLAYSTIDQQTFYNRPKVASLYE